MNLESEGGLESGSKYIRWYLFVHVSISLCILIILNIQGQTNHFTLHATDMQYIFHRFSLSLCVLFFLFQFTALPAYRNFDLLKEWSYSLLLLYQ